MKNVLLVDDSLDILNFFEMFLNRFKIPCVKAHSGGLAIRSYDREKVSFVFLDIQLGDMSGFDVLSELKKRDPDVRVIMLSGKSDKDFENRARELGVLDYLTKPVDLGELKRKLDKYILSGEPLASS